MFSPNECTIYLTVICLIQMRVQDTWQYTFSTYELYNILDNIGLVQMSVQYTSTVYV